MFLILVLDGQTLGGGIQDFADIVYAIFLPNFSLSSFTLSRLATDFRPGFSQCLHLFFRRRLVVFLINLDPYNLGFARSLVLDGRWADSRVLEF